VSTDVLDLARQHQIGRVSKNDTAVSFGITEGWFRKFGTQILDLTRQHQIGRVPKNGTAVPFDFTKWWFCVKIK